MGAIRKRHVRPLFIGLGVAAAIPFAAALVVGLCTGRITPAAWARLGADLDSQPILFWLLVFFNAAMSAALIYACSTIIIS
jgi:hypothetical protein